MCMVCRGNSQKYVIKAEDTKEYVDTVTFLKREQTESTGIKNSVQDDVENGQAYNGYVKLCATWVRRFWMPEIETDNGNFQVLNEPTKIFDDCGANDIKDGGGGVPYGSKKAEWSNAVKFFNWYGIPEMEGFGVIIIND